MSKPARILVVDDEPDLRSLFIRVFRRDGHEVVEAASGTSALECVRTSQFDLILLDLYLGDTTGLDILERIIKVQPGARVVIMTGNGEIETAVRAMKLGAIDYLLKPLEPEQLRRTARALLAAGDPSQGVRLERPIVGESPQIRETWAQVEPYTLPDIGILLLGESGTGKELFARAVHERSKRRGKPFVPLDCATLPDTLVESEIFGHEKGAFTGASDRRIGKFELANGGTLFLDEIGNLPLQVQAKLLRVLQERCIERLGGTHPVSIDVRVIAATNLDVDQAIAKGAFRHDLYFRLAEVVVRLPALRDRSGDVLLVARHFIAEFNRRFGRHVQGLTEAAEQALVAYRWPGNVRELQNVIKASVLIAEEKIDLGHLPDYLRRPSNALPPSDTSLEARIHEEVERGLAAGVLDLKQLVATYVDEIEGHVLADLLERRRFTQGELSSLLSVDPKTLRAKLQKIDPKPR